MLLRARHTLVLGALLLATGCETARTEMVVVIHTDGLRVPDDVDALHIQVIDRASTGDDSLFDKTEPLCPSTQKCLDFPVTMTLFPGPMRPSDSVRVRVDALHGVTPVISDAAVFTFAKGRSLELDVTLWSTCLGKTDCAAQDEACGSDQRCAPLTPEPFSGDLDFSQVRDLGAPVDLTGLDLAGVDLSTARDLSTAHDLSATTDLSTAIVPDLSHDAALPPPAPAAFVQKSVYCQSSANCTLFLVDPSTAGDLLVVSCALASDSNPVLPVGWTQAVIDQPGTGANVSLWYYLDAAGGTSSVLVSGGISDTIWAELSEWSGPTTLDVTGIKTTVSSSSTTATTSAPANGSVGVSIFGMASIADPVTFTQSSWTNLANNSGLTTGWHVTTDYLLAPPLNQPLSVDAMANFAGAWYGALATFR